MLAFSYRVKAKNGKFIIDRVHAETVADAWSELERLSRIEGHTELELLDNEGTAIKLDDKLSNRRLWISAEEAQIRQAQTSIYWTVARIFFKEHLIILLGLSYALIYGYHSFFITDPIINQWQMIQQTLATGQVYWYLLLLLLGYLAWFTNTVMPMVVFNQLLDAGIWRRWQEVEKYARWLLHRNCLPKHKYYLLFQLANVDAAQGRLEQALQRVTPLETDNNISAGMYYNLLASVFTIAKDFQQTLDCNRKAVAVHPSTSTHISLAQTLVRYFKQYEEAQALLDEIDVNKLPLLEQKFFYYVQGIIHLETGHAQQACHDLERVFAVGRNFGNPLAQGTLLLIGAYYGLALAAVGNHTMAEQYFKPAYPLLIVHQESELLERCNKARGI